MAESLEHAWECGHVPLCKVFPSLLGCREKGAGLLPIQSKFAGNDRGCCCCCCFLFLPLNFFFFFFGQLSTSLKCFNEEILTAGRSGDEKQS